LILKQPINNSNLLKNAFAIAQGILLALVYFISLWTLKIAGKAFVRRRKNHYFLRLKRDPALAGRVTNRRDLFILAVYRRGKFKHIPYHFLQLMLGWKNKLLPLRKKGLDVKLVSVAIIPIFYG